MLSRVVHGFFSVSNLAKIRMSKAALRTSQLDSAHTTTGARLLHVVVPCADTTHTVSGPSLTE